MKKVLFLVFLLTVIWNTSTVKAGADKIKTPAAITIPKVKERKLTEQEVKVLVDRINEIRQLDEKKLSKQEKRALRKEVKGIKNKLDGGYIYISGTALLIIILLLLLL
jgi:hypothetical protein